MESGYVRQRENKHQSTLLFLLNKLIELRNFGCELKSAENIIYKLSLSEDGGGGLLLIIKHTVS